MLIPGRVFRSWFKSLVRPSHRHPRYSAIERLEDRAMLSGETWAVALGGAADDIPVAIAATVDGGYAVVGNTLSFDGSDQDVWINRFGADGSLLWSKTYGHNFSIALRTLSNPVYNTYGYDIASDIQSNGNGSFTVTGQALIAPGQGSVGWVMTVDSQGQVTEDRGNTFNATNRFTSVAGALIGGNSTLAVYNDLGKGSFSRYAPLAYIGSPEGGFLYGDLSTDTYLNQIIEGSVVVGVQGVNGAGTLVATVNGPANVFGFQERGVSIAKTPADGLGAQYFGVASSTVPLNINVPVSAIVRKLNASLDPVWEVLIPGHDARSIVAMPDGGFVVALLSNESSSTILTGQNVLLLRLDADGNKVWAKVYGGQGTEGQLVNFPFFTLEADLVATNDGFAFTVSTNSFGTDDSTLEHVDYWVVKTDLNGNIPVMTGLVHDVTATLSVSQFVGSFQSGLFHQQSLDDLNPLSSQLIFGDHYYNETFPNPPNPPITVLHDKNQAYGGPLSVETENIGVATRVQSTPTYNSGSFQFAQDLYSVDENGFVDLLITRTDGTHGSYGRETVEFTVSSNGATQTSDYFPDSGPFNIFFEPGQLTQTIRIYGNFDTAFDPGESVTVTLGDPDPLNFGVIGARSSTVVAINNTTPAPGTFELSAATYSIDENRGTLAIIVNLLDQTTTFTSVEYSVTAGTATGGLEPAGGVDFITSTGILNFFTSGIASATFLISINDDAIIEGDETIHIQLFNPTNGALLGTVSSAVVTINDVEPEAQPIQPKINGKIAFLRDEDFSGVNDIYVINANGTGTVNVTNSPMSWEYTPSWSPDGSKLAFYAQSFSDPELPSGIYSMNADGSGRTLLVESQSVSDPIWSPDGTQIAYIDNGQLAMMNADGRFPHTFNVVIAAPLRWSPDGTHVAFQRLVTSPTFTQTPAIFEVGSDGFGERQLFSAFLSADEFSYSADGTQMVFRGELEDVTGIYRANIDGTGVPVRLADKPLELFLSPDGTKLLYTQLVSSISQVFISNLNGSSPAAVTTGNPAKFEPVWQPLLAGGGDTTAPVPLSAVANLATINNVHAGVATFTITIVFDEAMNTAVIPTLSFPSENPGATLSLNAGQSGWTNSTTYVAKYNVTDVDVAVSNVDVRIAGGKDIAGNLQSATTFTNRFSIAMSSTGDSTAPTVTKFERFNPAEQQTNAPAMVFRATFSEPVDSSTVDPTDFVVSGGTTAAVSLAHEVAGSDGTIFEIIVTGGNLSAFNGLVGLDVSETTNITDLSGNVLVVSDLLVDEVYSRTTMPTLIVGGTAARWKKRQPPTKVLPLITVSGESFAGSTLVLSINAVIKKGKPIDQFVIPNVASIGTGQGLEIVNGKLTLQIRLGANATAGTIQNFLRGITFSTKGPGLKVSQRTINLTLTNSLAQSGIATQTITVS